MVLATLAIQKGIVYWDNPDKNNSDRKSLLPGAGSVVTFVEPSQIKPVYIGKPKAIIMELSDDCAFRRGKEQVIMVGDNYETDIQGFKNGIDTCCYQVLP